MTSETSVTPAGGIASRGRFRFGDTLFGGLTGLGAAGVVALLGLVAWKVVAQAWPAFDRFGFYGFVSSETWDAVKGNFGALTFIYGTLVTSFLALLLALPISVAIALFLNEIAPLRIRGAIGALIELLAAIPSVVLGLWGILVFGPWIRDHLEPFLGHALGWIPLFSGSPSQAGMLPAILILTLMITPIISSLCRELFARVPRDMTSGALALGATRWETIRSVSVPYVLPGIAAAALLGLGRAFGEAIAVTQVIGGSSEIRASLFEPGDTLASRIAAEYQSAASQLQLDSLLGLAAVLLVISLITNIAAQVIVRRFERARRGL